MKSIKLHCKFFSLSKVVTCALLLYYATNPFFAVANTPVILADNNVSLHNVIVSATASPEITELANELSTYLTQISGAEFTVRMGDGTAGIAVGLASDFPAIQSLFNFDPTAPGKIEQNVIRSHRNGLYLIGATELGTKDAVWGFLHRLGYRQYFPGDSWEYIPHLPRIEVSIDDMEKPTFASRSIVTLEYGSEGSARKEKWQEKNRFNIGMNIATHHAYGAISGPQYYAEEFAAHPEYLTEGGKFCVYEPGLQQLAVDYAFSKLTTVPTLDAVSLTPSDGLGSWEGCNITVPVATSSDMALFLANTVATALRNSQEYPDKGVGMLAYGDTSLPPSLYGVDENVYIYVAEAFMQNGLSFEDVAKGWKAAGAKHMGTYDYPAVITWSWGEPGKGKITRYNEWFDTLNQHKKYFDFISGEGSASWGIYGLGYWMYAQTAWRPSTEDNTIAIAKLKNDFFTKMFINSAPQMQQFYNLIDGEPYGSPLSSDLIGRLYTILQTAMTAESDPMVHSRIRELALYVRYVELYRALRIAQSVRLGEQTAMVDLLRHVTRIRDTHMVAYYELFSFLGILDTSFEITDLGRVNDVVLAAIHEQFADVLEAAGLTKINPWSAPIVFPEPFYNDAAIDAMITSGISANPLKTWVDVSYSKNLVNPEGVELNPVQASALAAYFKSDREFFLLVEDDDLTVELTSKSGMLYTDKGNAYLDVLPADSDVPIATHTLLADKTEYVLPVSVPEKGLYRIRLRDNKGGTRLTWPIDLRMTESKPEAQYEESTSAIKHYFYVPKGTTVLGGFKNWAGGTIVDPDGEIYDPDYLSYFSIAVTPEKAGKLWHFNQCYQCTLQTVPPYLFYDEQQVILPAEVVEADRVM